MIVSWRIRIDGVSLVRVALAPILLLALSSVGLAQPSTREISTSASTKASASASVSASANAPTNTATERHVRLELTDGSSVTGLVRSETAEVLSLESPVLGLLQIPRDRIVRVIELSATPEDKGRPDGARGLPGPRPPRDPADSGTHRSSTGTADVHGWPTDPDYNSLLFVPTSETLQKGDIYYRNFELLFNNIGASITDDISLSFMSAFPVTSSFTIFSFGAKVRALSRERSPIGLAVAASTTFGDEISFQNYSGILSVGNIRRSATFAANLLVDDDGDTEAFFLVGGDLQIAPRVKLLLELGNSAAAIDDDFSGLANFGFRAFWEKVSFTLTAFRPLEGADELLAVPFASFSAHF